MEVELDSLMPFKKIKNDADAVFEFVGRNIVPKGSASG